VIRLAAEIDKSDATTVSSGAMYRWVYLFPLLAARLRSGETEEAVAAAWRIIDPSQQFLPDDLTTALAAACQSWDQDNHAETAHRLTEAPALAYTRGYF
jgi:hypothetical protein